MGAFKQNGIDFTIENNFLKVNNITYERKHTIQGKVNVQNPSYSIVNQQTHNNECSKLLNAVDIDWNSAILPNSNFTNNSNESLTIKTTGAFLSLLNTMYVQINNIKNNIDNFYNDIELNIVKDANNSFKLIAGIYKTGETVLTPISVNWSSDSQNMEFSTGSRQVSETEIRLKNNYNGKYSVTSNKHIINEGEELEYTITWEGLQQRFDNIKVTVNKTISYGSNPIKYLHYKTGEIMLNNLKFTGELKQPQVNIEQIIPANSGHSAVSILNTDSITNKTSHSWVKTYKNFICDPYIVNDLYKNNIYRIYITDNSVPNTQNITFGSKEIEVVPYCLQYLTFIATENDTTFSFTKAGLSYSIDNGLTWRSLTANASTRKINANSKIIFKGNLTPTSSNGIGTFDATKNFNVVGNPMSLIYGDSFGNKTSLGTKNYAFKNLFKNCKKLVNANNLILHATTLSDSCYVSMFEGCESLISIPKLSATTLANSCYQGMFKACKLLTTPPVLEATTLKSNCYNEMFSGCTNLTSPPALSATTLANGCYKNMFKGCTSLTTAPALPATTLAESCYEGMFKGCTLLTVTPKLSATTLALSCYEDMFNGCKALTTIIIASNGYALPATTLTKSCYSGMFNGCELIVATPKLPATTLAESCYESMFNGCKALTTITLSNNEYALPATTLTKSCYRGMFSNCINLISIPDLPSRSLAESCYEDMFYNCSSLLIPENYILPATELKNSCYAGMFTKCINITRAPELPALNLINNCYELMFKECSNLTYIKALFITKNLNANTSEPDFTRDWVYGVANSGTFVKNPQALWYNNDNNTNTYYNANLIPKDSNNKWTLIEEGITFENEHLTINALEDANISFSTSGLSYSKNHGAWVALQANVRISLSAGDYIRFKGSLTPTSSNGIGTFSATGKFNVSGNIMSLIYGDNFKTQKSLSGKNYAFKQLFYNCKKLIDTRYLSLPATTLAEGCYYEMFAGCTNLITAPDLPALNATGAQKCYYHMFESCSSLTVMPSINLTAVSYYCCTAMFRGCINLSTISIPTASSMAEGCYGSMFQDCNGLTTLNINLPATTLAIDCYASMFRGCMNLTTVSSTMLNSGTTLQPGCYESMFRECTKLTATPKLPATTLANNCYQNMFNGCAKLTTITITDTTNGYALPATTLTYKCYEGMFEHCTSLTKTPKLHGATLANYCYNNMFKDCTNLTTITAIQNSYSLPVTSLANAIYCYSNMFNGCTSLTTAPSLPATTLSNGCYSGMFGGCTSLTSAPTLPATTLADYCYSNMFNGCIALTSAPVLSVTTLTNNCYESMFKGCINLTSAPELPAITLVTGCYSNMFNGCTQLNYIKADFITTPSSSYTSNWVNNVANSGTFVKSPKATWQNTFNSSAIPKNNDHKWTVDIKLDEMYFTLTGVTTGNIKFSNSGLSYLTTNMSNWASLTANTEIQLNAGQDIIFKGTISPNSSNGIGTFSVTGNFIASGNIMSLLYGDNFKNQKSLSGKNYAFKNLFKNCETLVNANNLLLQATTLSSQCYFQMFNGCKSLVSAPALPATIVTDYCYASMFSGCTLLASAPELKATSLTQYCYASMFRGCKTLTETPKLPATTLAECCYQMMFAECENLVKLTPINNNGNILPATTLAKKCYNTMFSSCKSLTSWNDTQKIGVPQNLLQAQTLAEGCYSSMFSGCRSLTTAPALTAPTLCKDCYNGMFANCTSLTSAPELLVETLVEGCYSSMFNGCSKLNYIKALFTTDITSNTTYTNIWVTGVASTGTFVKNGNATWEKSNSVHGIPTGWAVEYIPERTFKDKYFTLTGKTNSNKFKFTKAGLSYSTNGGWTWITLSANTEISVAKNNSVIFKGSFGNASYSNLETAGNGIFMLTEGEFDVSGNIMSLVYGVEHGDNFKNYTWLNDYAYVFANLFRGCYKLINAKDLVLPATSISIGCYTYMFCGCGNLITAPSILPSLSLRGLCYYGMFQGCSKLVETPNLKFNSISSQQNGACQHMFEGCTSLTTVSDLLITSIDHSRDVYSQMFKECSSLVKSPYIKLRTWTKEDIIPICEEMFYGCSNLITINTDFTIAPDVSTHKNWLYGVASSGYRYITWKRDTTSITRSPHTVPSGWTIIISNN